MIIISGASGYIGQNLLKSINNSQGLSLRDENWKSQLSEASAIINLVGKAHDHQGIATKQDYFHANLDLTKDIFNSFMNSNTDLLIHISSIAAIEEFESKKPLQESDICNPKTWYGKSKLAAEEWLLNQEITNGKKLIIIRPPMIYGPGDKGNLKLMFNIVSKKIPFPINAFNNNRSFISIYNFNFIIDKVLSSHTEMKSGIYHVSDDQTISTKEIVEIINDVTGNKIMNLPLSKGVLRCIAKFGDISSFPLNSQRFRKMTSDLIVSNIKIKDELEIIDLPYTTHFGMKKTIESFISK